MYVAFFSYAVLLCCFTVNGYLPNYLYKCDKSQNYYGKESKVDHTHESITELAVSKVISQIASKKIPPGKYSTFIVVKHTQSQLCHPTGFYLFTH